MKLKSHSKSFFYWLRVVAVAILGIYLGTIIDETDTWLDVRYKIFQLLQHASPRTTDVQRTVFVTIGDQEYWRGELQGRVPIKRDYLAKIVDAASASHATVIALDFDFRSPSPEGNPIELPEYKPETQQLIAAIKRATTSNRKICLTRTVTPVTDDIFTFESDIYGPEVPNWENVTTGHHLASDDRRNLPPALRTKNGTLVDSFPVAIARADNAPSLRRIHDFTTRYYTGFLERSQFPTVPASELLDGKRQSELDGKVVIVAGIWHESGYGRGDEIRSWDTPVGKIPGAFIIANYYEALFDKRFYRVWEGWPVKLAEFVLALLVALPFALELANRKKKIFAFASPYILIGAVTYISLINFGLFFDPFVPIVSVSIHGLFERVWHWRQYAKARH